MSKIVVADLYQLTMLDGKPSKEHKVLIRPKVKVQESWVKATNDNWQDTSKLYVVDEDATIEYEIKSQETNQLRATHSDLQKAASVQVLADAVNTAIEIKTKKSKKTETKTE